VVWGDLRRHAAGIARLTLEPVLPPARCCRDDRLIRPLQDDFVALAGDAAEGAVGVDQVIGVVVGVHYLLPGKEIADRFDTQQRHQQRHPPDHPRMELGRRHQRRRA